MEQGVKVTVKFKKFFRNLVKSRDLTPFHFAMSTWVCVTGGSGYVASVLIKELLTRGYNVKATVRNAQHHKGTFHCFLSNSL